MLSTLIYNAIFFYSIVDFTFPIFDDTKLPITSVVVGKDSLINYSIVDEQVKIGDKCVIGRNRGEAEGITVIARGVEISSGTNIDSNVMIDENR